MNVVAGDSSEEEPAQGPDAATAVPEEDEAEGGGGAVHPAGPDRPRGGGAGVAHAGGHRPAAALVRGEDEQGPDRSGGQDAEGPYPSFLPCTLTGTCCCWTTVLCNNLLVPLSFFFYFLFLYLLLSKVCSSGRREAKIKLHCIDMRICMALSLI